MSLDLDTGLIESGKIGQAFYDPVWVRTWGRRIFGAVLAVFALGVTALSYYAATRVEPWVPLGPYPIQHVLDGDATIDVNNGGVKIEGTKCREGTEGVQVHGSLRWKRVAPAGFTSDAIYFSPSVQPNGCTTSEFVNRTPQEVKDDVCRSGPSLWHISGDESPIGDVVRLPVLGDSGRVVTAGLVEPRDGLAIGWETETFTLTCDLEK